MTIAFRHGRAFYVVILPMFSLLYLSKKFFFLIGKGTTTWREWWIKCPSSRNKQKMTNYLSVHPAGECIATAIYLMAEGGHKTACQECQVG